MRSRWRPETPRSSDEPDVDEMKAFPKGLAVRTGLFLHRGLLVSVRLGAGVGVQALSSVSYPSTPGTPNVTRTHHRRTG